MASLPPLVLGGLLDERRFASSLPWPCRPLTALFITLSLAVGCVEQTSDAPTEEDVKGAKENILQTAPTPRFPVNAVLLAPPGQGHGKVTYLGLDVDASQVSAGKPFTLTHYFRVEEPISEGWRLFVHLEAPPDKRSHLNADHVPINGKYPVGMWKKGEIIRDIHKVSVPAGWPSDKLDLYVGLWKGQLRFKVESGPHDADNRVLVASLPVVGDSVKAAGAAASPSMGGGGGKRLVVRKLKAGTVIHIDGKLDEPAWKEAASTGPFVNTLTGGAAEQAAEARALWDDQFLYIAFDFADRDVWGTLTKHDDKLWTEEAAELFLDADGDGKTYVELQISPRNVTFDSWLPAYRQNDNAFDVPMTTAVQVNGTLDNRKDEDKGWTAELKIPLSAAKGRLAEMKGVPPVPGTQWRANFFRMDIPAGKPQQASGWSPPMVPDFHAVDKFGVLVFADENGGVPEPAKANLMQAVPIEGGSSGPHPVNPNMRRLMLAHPEQGGKGDDGAQAPAAQAPTGKGQAQKGKHGSKDQKGKAGKAAPDQP